METMWRQPEISWRQNLIIIFMEVKEEWQCVIPLLTLTISIFVIFLIK